MYLNELEKSGILGRVCECGGNGWCNVNGSPKYIPYQYPHIKGADSDFFPPSKEGNTWGVRCSMQTKRGDRFGLYYINPALVYEGVEDWRDNISKQNFLHESKFRHEKRNGPRIHDKSFQLAELSFFLSVKGELVIYSFDYKLLGKSDNPKDLRESLQLKILKKDKNGGYKEFVSLGEVSPEILEMEEFKKTLVGCQNKIRAHIENKRKGKGGGDKNKSHV